MKIHNVLIVDDHRLFAAGLRSILEQEPERKILSAVDANEALELISKHNVDLILMDLQMPESSMSGVELTKHIRKKYPKIKILVVSMEKSVKIFNALIEAGAHGYMLKDSGDETLKRAIKYLEGGKEYWDPCIMELIVKARRMEGDIAQSGSKSTLVLTKREKEVLTILAQGMSSKEIAEQLFIGTSTVDTHRKNLIAKFEAKNSTEVVIKAKEQGLL